MANQNLIPNTPTTTTTTTTTQFPDDGYSPAQTLIPFTRPIPLIRVPIPDDPDFGPYVLAFPNPTSFLAALSACQSELQEQCESGSRVGCSISASNKCAPPWWKSGVFGFRVDFEERARCEEREMEGCLVGVSEKCVEFAEEKCLGPFRSARVRNGSGFGLFGLLGRGVGSDSGSTSGFKGGDGRCYVRGSEILGRCGPSS